MNLAVFSVKIPTSIFSSGVAFYLALPVTDDSADNTRFMI
jgi:hypothetical protein